MTAAQARRWMTGSARVPPHFVKVDTWTAFAQCCEGHDVIGRVTQYDETTFGIESFGPSIDAMGNRWPRTRVFLSGVDLDAAINEADSQLADVGWRFS